MSEKYWAKIYRKEQGFFNFQAELYENEQLDDTLFIARQIKKKKFFTMYSAKKWVDKKIINSQDFLTIKDYNVLGEKENG
jgi:hypothetical protein